MPKEAVAFLKERLEWVVLDPSIQEDVDAIGLSIHSAAHMTLFGEVLELLKRGLSNAAIASELVISVSTAKVHVHHVLAKLGVKTRLQAVLKAGELESGAARQRLSQRLE